MATSSTFSIRSIPPELRIPIFEQALVRNNRRQVPALLKALETDPELYNEALHLFYRLNVFGLCELAPENQLQRASTNELGEVGAFPPPIPNAEDVQKLSINFCSGFTALNTYDFRINLHSHLPSPGREILESTVNVRELHICLYLHIDRWVTDTPTVEAPIKLLATTLPRLERVVFEWWNAGPGPARSIVGAWHREFSRASGVKPRPLKMGATESGIWEWVADKGELLTWDI